MIRVWAMVLQNFCGRKESWAKKSRTDLVKKCYRNRKAWLNRFAVVADSVGVLLSWLCCVNCFSFLFLLFSHVLELLSMLFQHADVIYVSL